MTAESLEEGVAAAGVDTPRESSQQYFEVGSPVKGLIPNEGGWRGWRVGLGVGVEVFT